MGEMPVLLMIFGMVLPWVLVALVVWLGFQLVLQNGRLLLRLEAIEARLAVGSRPPTPSLPLGKPAPEFDLPDLEGARKSLSQFKGRRLLLIFFGPQCGFCTKMLPDLA